MFKLSLKIANYLVFLLGQLWRNVDVLLKTHLFSRTFFSYFLDAS